MATKTWCVRNVLRRSILSYRRHLVQTRCMGSDSDGKFRLEPDYLDVTPEIPEYDTIRIRMRAYDFVPLESFAKHAHNLVDRMGIDCELWPVPARTTRVQTYKPNSTKVLSEYNLAQYERILELRKVPSTVAPLLLENLQQNLPEGVNFTVKEPDEDEDEFRFVPDLMKMELEAKIVDVEENMFKK